ncbi:MAG: filamentous hemagglutinin N-terminal domain-containing protein [Planctomycetota bacterium]|jgi:filamentous hemagglutinin family protein
MKKLTKVPTLQFVHKTIACLLAFCVINAPLWAIKNGDVINNGGANIAITDNVLTNVNLGNAAETTIEWGSIDTIENEVLNFNGQGNFAVLNNVTSNDVTNFSGILNGNGGNIMIVNPNGLVFGATAQISAGHFTASTLAVADFGDFVNGEGSWFNANDAMGAIELQAGSSINAKNINLIAQEIKNSGHLVSDGGLVILATGDEVFLGNSADDIVVQVDLPARENLSYSISNEADGVIQTNGGDLVMAAGDDFAQAVLPDIQDNAYRLPGEYTVLQAGSVEGTRVDMSAANSVITQAASSTVADDINIGAMAVELGEALSAGDDLTIGSDHGVVAISDVTSGDQMSIISHSDEGSITLVGEAVSGGSMELSSGVSILLLEGATSGDSLTASAADGTLTFADIKAENDVTINSDLVMISDADQVVQSENGGITIDGEVEKLSENVGVTSNLAVLAKKDIQLNDNVTNYDGAVAVISTDGMIGSNGTDTVNVKIEGTSDETAVVLISEDTLKIGPGAKLVANGSYGGGASIDQRSEWDLLAEEGKVIGDFPRKAGDPAQIAIYAQSQSGNVVFNNLNNFQVNNNAEIRDATVVLDAFKKIIFNNGSGGSSEGQYRLEVVSRVTQWLGEAIDNDMLPFADNPEIMEKMLGNEYVMRGAGVPANDYHEAWVLEDMPDVPQLAAPLQQLELPELKGCPAEMDAAASELAVNTDQLQLMIANSMASNPSIQPCQACSSLLTTASALRDVDGTRMAALAEIFNTLAPADAPFTPEVQASVSTAFAELSADNPQYAMASEYAEAFANYVAILDNDLKLPIGDSVALVMEKYGEPVANADNPNIAAFINAQIEASGGAL